MEKLVIIGGGVAGLSCLNALLDNQVSPLLLEGGTIGSPKMCGEFLAPQALTILEQWGVQSIEYLTQACFHSTYSHFNLTFEPPAGALMRSAAEYQLSARAHKMGGRIRVNTRLTNLLPGSKKSPYKLYLESGEIIEAETVIFATGKIGQAKSKKIPLPYYGIKLHIDTIYTPKTLHMFSMPSAYLGIVPVSSTKSNLTCLIKKTNITPEESKFFLNQLMKRFPALTMFFKNQDLDQLNWLGSPSPHFTIKKIPAWPNAYWIGDALVSLHPAVGLGFAHSISSAILAVDFYLQKKPAVFANIVNAELSKKILLGKLMHSVLLSPLLTSLVYPLFQSSPWFLNKCLRRLGYRGIN